MRNIIFFVLALTCLFQSGCFKPAEPEPEPIPTELPAEIVFGPTSLPPPVEIKEETLQTAKKSVVADFNLDGLDDVAIVEEVEEPPPTGEDPKTGKKPASIAPIKPPEVTVYIKAKPKENVGAAAQKNLYHKAGVIPSILGRTVKGIMSRKTQKYTDLVILFKEDDGSTEMVHYQNKGSKFVKVEAVETEMPE